MNLSRSFGICVLPLLITSCSFFGSRSQKPTEAGSALRGPAQINEGTTRKGFVPINNLDPLKKTVCAITLNSDNEILAFREHLSIKDFQFVELVESKDKWLTRACESKVKCDILVVSGHFGGSFFGSNGRIDLSELEENTCGQGCTGIFHEPKEVFLFGCNTLAGKGKDRRTPEQYRQVLVNDGFNRAQADQIVALRYSPMGQSFSDRMARVFAGVPRIYGFSSVGPSGENVEPMLKDYFRKNGDYGKYLSASFTEDSVSKGRNKIFLNALRETVVEQTFGMDRSKGDIVPMCFVKDRTIPESKKIRWVHQVLKDPKTRLLYLAEILAYLNQTRQGPDRKLEMKLVAEIIDDKNLRLEMRGLVETVLKDFPLLRFDTLKIGLYFGWFSVGEVSEHQRSFLSAHLRPGMSRGDVDLLCSIPAVGELVTVDTLKDVTVEDQNFFSALECLRPKDMHVHRKLFEWTLAVLEDEYVSTLRPPVEVALSAAKIQNVELLREMLQILLKAGNERLAQAMADALIQSGTQDPFILEQLLDRVMLADSGRWSLIARNILMKLGPQEPRFQQRLLVRLQNTKSSKQAEYLIPILGGVKSRDHGIHRELLKRALDHTDQQNQQPAGYSLSQSRDVAPEIVHALLPMLFGGPGYLRGSMITNLALLSPRDPKVLEAVVYSMKMGDDYEVTSAGISFFEIAAPRDPEILSQLLQVVYKTMDEYQRSRLVVLLRKLAPEDSKIVTALKGESLRE